ncbi:MAG: histidine kinase, partial [Gammaproteobacteria bacterium]
MSQPEPLRESSTQTMGQQGKGVGRRFYAGLAMGLIPVFMLALVGLGSDPDRVSLLTSGEMLAGAIGIFVLWMLGFAVWARNALLRPLTALDIWASKIRQGDFAARLSDSSVGEIKGLTQNIDRLSEWLEALAQEREQELQIQRERLEQRAQLANELHDSLAQTLASLKFQVRVLDDTLRQDSEQAIWHEMERIEGSIDEANLELRELIAHFRAPQSEYGLVSGRQRLLTRLRQAAGVWVGLRIRR